MTNELGESVVFRGEDRSAPGPLTGITVVELAAGWAGPLASHILASLGALVVKVEAIQRPDWFRTGGGRSNFLRDLLYEQSAVFNTVNRRKLGITLNLKDPEGLELFFELVRHSDVLVENFSPHVMRSFGLSYETLARVNPGIILVSAPAFGLHGPWAEFPGFGSSVEELCGFSGITGYVDGPPENFASNLTDPLVGAFAALAALQAIVDRDATGKGQHVEVSHVEAGAFVLGPLIAEYSVTGNVPRRLGNRHPKFVPHGTFACEGTDQWISIAVKGERDWLALCSVLDSQFLRSPGFVDPACRRENEDRIETAIGRETVRWGKVALEDKLRSEGVWAAAVLSPAELWSQPQFIARGHLEAVDRAHVGTHLYPAFPAHFDGWSAGPSSAAPTLGEHNELVLRGWFGLAAERISELRAHGVIGNEPVA